MSNIKRLYPGSVNGLINWIEENFHDIDEFIVQFDMKDGTSMFVYDCYSYKNALGMIGMASNTINELSINDEFNPKVKE